MKVRFIGDVHGHLNDYARLTRRSEYSIAMGEMGFGKHLSDLGEMYLNGAVDGENHIIVPGNHDHYGVIDSFKTFLTTVVLEYC